jgi:hypothetical protein
MWRSAEDDSVREPLIEFPLTCPECAMVNLAKYPIAVIANALLTGRSLRLYASCHDKYWTATFSEREQLRKHLAGMNLEVLKSRTASEQSHDPKARKAQQTFV